MKQRRALLATLLYVGVSACLVAPVSPPWVQLSLSLPRDARSGPPLTGMTCFFVSVTGPGMPTAPFIAGAATKPECALGTFSPPVDYTTLTTVGASLRFPAGSQRLIRVLGVKSLDGGSCAGHTAADLATITTSDKVAVFTIAATTADIVRDTRLAMQSTYDATTAQDLARTCLAGGGLAVFPISPPLPLGVQLPLNVTGGTQPYTFAVDPATASGLTVSPTGLVSRVWTSSPNPVTVTVTDHVGKTATSSVDLVPSVVQFADGSVSGLTAKAAGIDSTTGAVLLAGTVGNPVFPAVGTTGVQDAFLAVVSPDTGVANAFQVGGGATATTTPYYADHNGAGFIIAGTTTGTLSGGSVAHQGQPGKPGSTDAFLSRINLGPTGPTTLGTWHVQLGGDTGAQQSLAAAHPYRIDSSNNSYVFGYGTESTGFGGTFIGAIINGAQDMFIMKVAADGSPVTGFPVEITAGGGTETLADAILVEGAPNDVVYFVGNTSQAYPAGAGISTEGASTGGAGLVVGGVITRTSLAVPPAPAPPSIQFLYSLWGTFGVSHIPPGQSITLTPKAILQNAGTLFALALRSGPSNPLPGVQLVGNQTSEGQDMVIVAVPNTGGTATWKTEILSGSAGAINANPKGFAVDSGYVLAVGQSIAPLNTPVVPSGTNDPFVVSLNQSGTFAGKANWLVQLGTNGGTGDPRGFLVESANNRVLVSGQTTGTMGYDPSPSPPPTLYGKHGSTDAFLALINFTDGSVTRVVQLGAGGTTNTFVADGLVSDGSGFLIHGSTTGVLPNLTRDTVPVPGAPGNKSLFVARFRSDLTLDWVHQLNTPSTNANGDGFALLRDSTGFLFQVGGISSKFPGPVYGAASATPGGALVKLTATGAQQ